MADQNVLSTYLNDHRSGAAGATDTRLRGVDLQRLSGRADDLLQSVMSHHRQVATSL